MHFSSRLLIINRIQEKLLSDVGSRLEDQGVPVPMHFHSAGSGLLSRVPGAFSQDWSWLWFCTREVSHCPLFISRPPTRVPISRFPIPPSSGLYPEFSELSHKIAVGYGFTSARFPIQISIFPQSPFSKNIFLYFLTLITVWFFT